MSEVSKLSRAEAKRNPGAAFSSPAEVVDEILMTRGEKIATLKRWRDEIVAQLRAADDGMQTRRTSVAQAELLQKIEAALADLTEPEMAQE
jgi:hypothetical protein